MPYKPRAEGFASLSVQPLSKLGVTLQERYISPRFISVRGLERMSAFVQTDLRVDAELRVGLLFFKVSNLFEEAGFENPAFPIPGRTYWVGYTL
jgi:hypothetical protein